MVQSFALALSPETGGPFQFTCLTLLLLIDLFCGLLFPIYETLYYLRYYRYKRQYFPAVTHWTTYWVFYALLHLLQRLLYFFPFAYEIRVLATLLMAHPKIQAASLIYNFLVTNPLITIKMIDARNRMREWLDKQVLPKL